MPFLFAVTLFVSAALLFCVQPMVAKMILPLLGGSPAVWNTCMVFFQAMLLAGYVYVHLTTTWLGIRWQAALHAGLLLLPFLLLLLPIGISPEALQSVPHETNPIPWLLGVLLGMVGLPFFVVSTSAPLLQRWFAGTGHPAANDPYFLYGASNLGSMLALMSYPLVLEPSFPLTDQSWLWAGGYGLLVLLALACALLTWRSHSPSPPLSVSPSLPPSVSPSVTWGRRLRWLALAFVPSSLMLGVTTYITTDIAAIPLLWVIPLALYLFTFTLVFARQPFFSHAGVSRALPIVILLAVVLLLTGGRQTLWHLLPVHVLTFFVAALFCHGELANDRPPAHYLTEFYLWMSLGGVLGGMWNALAAPWLFQGGIIEYPLALVLACLLRPSPGASLEPRGWRASRPSITWPDLWLPLGLCLLTIGLVLGIQAFAWKPSYLTMLVLFSLLAVVCYLMVDRPVRFALGLAAILLPFFTLGLHGHTLYAERNFFGSLRVRYVPEGNFHALVHGSTLHGHQKMDPEHRREPLSYFSRTGPIGQVFKVFNERPNASRVAVTGLGVGALASYARADQEWTYYEIDPAIKRVAQDPQYFTFLQDSAASDLQVLVGDARLRLKEAPQAHYDLIVLDAFSSDSIPVHLITQEALQLYLDKLADGGILVFNITNRYLNLRPVLGNLAQHARPKPLVCYVRYDGDLSREEIENGKAASQWVVMARREADLGRLAQDERWQRLPGQPGTAVWTDAFSNILSVLRWN